MTRKKKAPAKKKSDPHWMEKASAKMKAKGTKGSFKRAAKKAGNTVKEEERAVLKPSSKASPKMKKKALFARNVSKATRKKAKK